MPDPRQWTPQEQCLIISAAQDRSSNVTEAMGVYVFDECLPGDELLYSALDLVEPAYRTVDDQRRGGTWGADIPSLQVVLVTFGLSTGSGVVANGVWAGLRALRERFKARDVDVEGQSFLGGEGSRRPSTAAQAWNRFEHFARRAFAVDVIEAVSIEQRDDGWHIRARANELEIAGVVSLDGRLVEARRAR